MSTSHSRRCRSWALIPFVLASSATGLLFAPAVFAQQLHSVTVDRAGEKIIVRGSGFDVATEFTLGGVAVSTANVTPTQLEIPFSEEVANAVQWRGSYRLVVDGGEWISVYLNAPIEAPVVPPPPPPPPAGTECPCIAGWEASGIPKDNWTWCTRYFDGTQESFSGQRDNWFISVGLDPADLFFDPANPGNSVSYCALHDGTDWTVAEPVVNWDQFDDCEHWMWLKICI